MISSPPSAATIRLAGDLRPSFLKLGRELRRETARSGISALDAQILGAVKRNPGIGVSDLARSEQMSSPSMSAHVKRLEAAGLLARDVATDGDQRRTRLMLTERAMQSVKAVRQSRTDWLAARLARLDADQAAVLAAAAPILALLAEPQR
jgi:DNA-binding MarR family transcriptional regulator